MKPIAFDHYFTTGEQAQALYAMAEAFPELLRVSSLCKTPEGRDMMLAEVTNLKTGDFSAKPAQYVDGNHHAREFVTAMVAVYYVYYLVTEYGKDPQVTKLLDESTIYVIPCVTPDGADTYLTGAEYFRSVNRAYPYEQPQPGLHPKDMDGDGFIRQMRVKSPYGAWKESDVDPRWMVRRQPDDHDGDYYNLYMEGEILGYDGAHIQLAPEKWGLDFNRNYPYNWLGEHGQRGAGPYPLSNPETKAVAEFILAHKNIVNAATGHTPGGIILYPPAKPISEQTDQFDQKLFREMSQIATEELGYGGSNEYDINSVMLKGFLLQGSGGMFGDWLYEALGIPCLTFELWSLAIRAGVENFWPFPGIRGKTFDEKQQDYYLLIQWLDKNADKGAVKPWTKCVHPQLGEIEIGGFDRKFTMQNPPLTFMMQEITRTTKFLVRHAATLPHLQLDELCVAKEAEGVYRLSVVVTNNGYLPTYGCREAKKVRKAPPVKAEISCPGHVLGSATQQVGDLEGFSGVNTGIIMGGGLVTEPHNPCAKKVEWLIGGKPGDEVTVRVSGDRTGCAHAVAVL